MRTIVAACACALACAPAEEPRLSTRDVDGSGGKGGAGGGPEQGALRWAKHFGATGIDAARAVAAAPDGVAVAGSFDGTIDFGDDPLVSAGGRDAFVAYYDDWGTLLWSQRFGGPGDDEVAALSVDLAGSVLLTGSFTGTIDLGGRPLTAVGAHEIVVARLHPNGLLHWAHTFGGENDTAHTTAVSFDVACNAFVTGNFEGTFDVAENPLVSAGDSDAFVMKLDYEGNYQWSMALGEAGPDRVEALTVGIVAPMIGGSWNGDAFLASIDATGMLEWKNSYAGSRGTVRSISAAFGGDGFFAGSMSGSADFGASTLTSAGGDDVLFGAVDYTGAVLWARAHGDAANQSATGVAFEDKTLIVAGRFDGSLDFGTPMQSAGSGDLFVSGFDPDGEHRFSHSFGDGAKQLASGVDIGDQIGVVMAGTFEGKLDLPGSPFESAGASDGFLVSIDR